MISSYMTERLQMMRFITFTNFEEGREQVPRLEAVVDAIGTVTIEEGGSGYRRNSRPYFGMAKKMKPRMICFNSPTRVLYHQTDLTVHLPLFKIPILFTQDISAESFRAYPRGMVERTISGENMLLLPESENLGAQIF